MGLELGLEFVFFNRENPLFDKKTTYIIGNSIVKTIGDFDLENPPLGFPYYKSGLRVQKWVARVHKWVPSKSPPHQPRHHD